jgi:hypothetical protein
VYFSFVFMVESPSKLFSSIGRTDSKYLKDTSRGFTPPSRCSGVQIANTICRTNAVSRRLYYTNKNTHLEGGCYCLVPEAGLTRSILEILLGVLPRRRVAPASKLLTQFVEPMPFLADYITKTKTPT